MRTALIVLVKEVLENLRDRRTLMSALIMGPIFGPLLFSFVINLSIERSLESAEKTLELPVIGQAHAPNLVAFLRSRNIDAVDGPTDMAAAVEAVKTGEHDVVLVIPEAFGQQLADMVPARIELVSDQANKDADRESRRVRSAESTAAWASGLPNAERVSRGSVSAVARAASMSPSNGTSDSPSSSARAYRGV